MRCPDTRGPCLRDDGCKDPVGTDRDPDGDVRSHSTQFNYDLFTHLRIYLLTYLFSS